MKELTVGLAPQVLHRPKGVPDYMFSSIHKIIRAELKRHWLIQMQKPSPLLFPSKIIN